MKGMKRLAIAVLVALVVVVLAASLPTAAGPGAQVPVERLALQTFDHRVPAQGNLRAVRSTPIVAPNGIEGALRIAWLAPDGSRVRRGDVVVRFDSTDIEHKLTDAEGDLAGARLKAGKTRSQSLEEIEKLERDAAVARIELANASRFQKKDAEIFSRHDIIESEIDQKLAGAHEQHAEQARETRQVLAKTDLDLLAIDIRKADFKIQQARTALAALAVSVPHDGVLVLARNWRGEAVRLGDTVWSGQPLAEIPDLATMQAEAYVLEADAGGLAAGKPATVAVDSDPGTVYGARITRVDSLAKPRLRGSPVQYFAVTLALDRTEPRFMKPGQRIDAVLELDRRPSVLVVPRQAVFQRDGKTVVYRRGGATGFEPVAVTLGPSSMGRVVIDRGLAPGDVIALRDPTRPAGGATGGAGGSSSPGTPGAPAAPSAGEDEGGGMIMIGG
jgi:HlyD family secretion protein